MKIPSNELRKNNVRFTLVDKADIPFHCPSKYWKQWDTHPKVFLKFDKKGNTFCPYCGAKYKLQS